MDSRHVQVSGCHNQKSCLNSSIEISLLSISHLLFTLYKIIFTIFLSLHTSAPVFLEKWDALSLISRQKRSNADDEETKLPANLERECLEEVCNYEEAREVFQDNYRTVSLNLNLNSPV